MPLDVAPGAALAIVGRRRGADFDVVMALGPPSSDGVREE